MCPWLLCFLAFLHPSTQLAVNTVANGLTSFTQNLNGSHPPVFIPADPLNVTLYNDNATELLPNGTVLVIPMPNILSSGLNISTDVTKRTLGDVGPAWRRSNNAITVDIPDRGLQIMCVLGNAIAQNILDEMLRRIISQLGNILAQRFQGGLQTELEVGLSMGVNNGALGQHWHFTVLPDRYETNPIDMTDVQDILVELFNALVVQNINRLVASFQIFEIAGGEPELIGHGEFQEGPVAHFMNAELLPRMHAPKYQV
ncbi:MAG: hypothetical protein M1828_001087 [Chrysothrix sp. TS-e1954]|nr:MAG: hypothetical protein M1828_001087 [Chrysothrix sp. TS-e1954]